MTPSPERVAIITGASQGIGAGLTRAYRELAEPDREHCGANGMLQRLPGAEVACDRQRGDQLGGADRLLNPVAAHDTPDGSACPHPRDASRTTSPRCEAIVLRSSAIRMTRPGTGPHTKGAIMSNQLPDPRLSKVYRLEASLGAPMDLGEAVQGHRRIVPQTGGAFSGPEINGKLLPGASADWQIVMPDGTSFADIRYTLETDGGDLLYVQSRGVRHGSAEVLARLARGEDVDASEYTFRTSTQIETAAPQLDWLNKGVFISVGGRRAAGVIYETYLVG